MKDIIETRKGPKSVDFLIKSFGTLSTNSQLIYSTAINQFLDFFNIPIEKIATIDFTKIIEYVKHLNTKYSNATFNLKLTAIRQLYNKVNELFKIENPFDDLRRLKIKTNKKINVAIQPESCITKLEDMQKIIDYYTNRIKEEDKRTSKYSLYRNKILFKLIFENGLRVSEALNIKTGNITKQSDDVYFIKLEKTKNKETRIIKIDFFMYNAMIKLYEQMKNEENFIFVNRKNQRLSRIYTFNEIKKISKKVLNRSLNVHSLRHSFATIFYNQTNDIHGLSSYLGHKSGVAFTCKQYVHHSVDIKDLKKMRLTA